MMNPDAFAQLKQLKQEIRASRPLAEGRIKETPTKFGFVILEDGREIFLPPDENQKVLPHDKVTVEIINEDSDKPSAQIDSVRSSEVKTFIGRYIVKGKAHFVDAEIGRASRWMFIPPNKRKNAKEGDYIECQLLKHPFKNEGKAQAQVMQVIGNIESPGIEEALTIKRYNLSESFPEECIKQANAIIEKGIEEHKAGRSILLDTPFVTIDSASTLDMDDALYAEKHAEGWLLKIAIADPASLIPENSPLDIEARKRATSTYLVGNNIPMLPKTLSQELCSLTENEERLAQVLEVEVSNEGDIINHTLSAAVISSAAKLSYDQVADWLTADNQDEIPEVFLERDNGQAIFDSLKHLKRLAEQLRQKRSENIINERADYKIHLDENKRVTNITKLTKTIANIIVEEAMVAANSTIAKHLVEQKISAPFISHSGIKTERIADVIKLLAAYDVEASEEQLTSPVKYQKLIKSVSELPVDVPLAILVNRNLDRSELVLEAKSHIGMGLDQYTTFTSPIRKYQDLLVHRSLAAADQTSSITEEQLKALSAQQFITRSAANDLEQWYKCLYSETLTGQTYDATICGINSAGFHSRIEENGIEGFIFVKDLGTQFDGQLNEHKSEKYRFQLGQALTIKVSKVNWDRKQVIFELAN